MGFFSNLFSSSSRGFTDGSSQVESSGTTPYLQGMFHPDTLIVNDNNYLTLSEEQFKNFVFKYYDKDMFGMGYHSNSDEFPDCDDYAAISFAAVLRGAIKEGFKYAPVFGVIDITLKEGGGHALNFAMTSNNKVWLFEPQNGIWTELKDYGKLATVMNMEL